MIAAAIKPIKGHHTPVVKAKSTQADRIAAAIKPITGHHTPVVKAKSKQAGTGIIAAAVKPIP